MGTRERVPWAWARWGGVTRVACPSLVHARVALFPLVVIHPYTLNPTRGNAQEYVAEQGIERSPAKPKPAQSTAQLTTRRRRRGPPREDAYRRANAPTTILAPKPVRARLTHTNVNAWVDRWRARHALTVSARRTSRRHITAHGRALRRHRSAAPHTCVDSGDGLSCARV